MREPRVLRLAHAARRFPQCPHARTVPRELLHERGRVGGEVAVRDLRELVGGGDGGWERLAREDGDPGDRGVGDGGADDFEAGYGGVQWIRWKMRYPVDNTPAPVAPVTINFIVEPLEGVKASFASLS